MEPGDLPIAYVAEMNNKPVNLGLTKREYFAAMAMQGIFASGLAEPTKDIDFKNIAEDAIRSADELLNQLEK